MSGGAARTEIPGFWKKLNDELASTVRPPAQVEEMPVRSTGGSTGYGVRLTSLGGYRVFAYFSVPHGAGPFPAVFQAPGYGSVVHVPPYERRQKYAVLALCHRGQRHSDIPYAAKYPGLLTDGIPDARSYVWRGIVADCLAAVDFLLARPEVDPSRVAAVGNDLALITAGLRPRVGAVLLTGDLLFRDTFSRLSAIRDYPLEELNDYLRAHPGDTLAVQDTLGLFDPAGFAAAFKGRMLISCSAAARSLCGPLAAAGRNVQLRVNVGRGYTDHTAEEQWLDGALASPLT